MSTMTDRAGLVRSHLIDHIAQVVLRVRNIDTALGFYRDIVGLDVADRSATSADLRSQGGPVFLTLESEGVSAPADPRATGLFHNAIRFPTRSSLGDALARLVAAGYEIGAGDHLVSEALYIDDPDGNGVELYWDRPEEQWAAPTPDMLVPMATLPVDLQGLLAEGTGRASVGQPAPAATDMGHVHLQVSDVETTTRFFVDEVGLDRVAQLGPSAGFYSSNGYHHNIGANTWRSRGSKPTTPNRAGLTRIVFAVQDENALETLRTRLQDHGRSVTGIEGQNVMVQSPDNLELHFTLA
jgi:catechol 2,3-dioxygenase